MRRKPRSKNIFKAARHFGCRPVQFLPSADALSAEAVMEAVDTEVEGAPTRVMAAEHLVALALQQGCAKDHGRMLQFIEAGVPDIGKLDAMLSRHGLSGKWSRFERLFRDGAK